ncbi:hypothetical protein KUCAC02_023862, partial [Chaenocephalus aceratus]
ETDTDRYDKAATDCIKEELLNQFTRTALRKPPPTRNSSEPPAVYFGRQRTSLRCFQAALLSESMRG